MRARADHGIDWVIVVMYQTAISPVNGADRGVRTEQLPTAHGSGRFMIMIA